MASVAIYFRDYRAATRTFESIATLLLCKGISAERADVSFFVGIYHASQQYLLYPTERIYIRYICENALSVVKRFYINILVRMLAGRRIGIAVGVRDRWDEDNAVFLILEEVEPYYVVAVAFAFGNSERIL